MKPTATLFFAFLPLITLGQSPVSTDIVEKASKSVVLIKGVIDGGTVSGSGFLLSSDGKIATNVHVIRDMKSGGVQLQSGEVYDSFTVLAFDDRKDIAIIKIPGFDLPAIELGNSNDLKPGEPVMAIGSPQGIPGGAALQGTVTAGVVSAIRDDLLSREFKVIQTDAAVNPGNSGGPLLSGKGQAVGIIEYKVLNTEGLHFAIPINYLRGLMSSTEKAMTLAEFRASLSVAPVDAFKGTESFPTRWKSLVTGHTFTLRKDSDVVYAERAFSDAQRQMGNFSSVELHKDKDGYTGKEHLILVGSYFFWGSPGVNRCTFDYDFLITSLSASRIEGQILEPPPDADFEIRECAYYSVKGGKATSKVAPRSWQKFVWIPQ
jgi:Trypsin-like peptidase domain